MLTSNLSKTKCDWMLYSWCIFIFYSILQPVAMVMAFWWKMATFFNGIANFIKNFPFSRHRARDTILLFSSSLGREYQIKLYYDFVAISQRNSRLECCTYSNKTILCHPILSLIHTLKERCIVCVILFSIHSFMFAVFLLLCSVCIKYSSEQNHFTTLNSIMSDYAMCSICHLPGSFFSCPFPI